ncbi:DUF4329 domain-containing protein [Pseudomonas sp. Marseille-Q1929]|uniref:DUF4329 domain-containing protein n=1 Tax=Pseudomonas sp. Marseille-Q1929 TaxID=2730402 RepID=UPI001A8E39AD|nr:DUF4329 domain-containing protein [Pseudomonas sp. Marseille-Q1929]MBO0494808.1 DUF4329 domain-containing protein [Pseudomonas sp. Marseille-Q1929]
MNEDDPYPSDLPAPALEAKLALEGPFISADDAAFWAHQRIDKRDAEYGGAILRKAGRFYASTPVRGGAHEFTPSDVIALDDEGKMLLPSGYAPYAFYHSHPDANEKFKNSSLTEAQRSVLRGFFSYHDTRLIIDLGAVVPAHYLSGPDGGLLKYVTSDTPKERELRKRIALDSYKKLHSFDDFIPLLAEAGELTVVVANSAWGGERGRVTKSWKLGTPLSDAGMQPLCSKIASTPSLGHLLPEGPEPVFGYQLKALDKDEYIVPTQAWERRELTDPSRLFPKRADGGVKLPSGFRISAVYCRLGTAGMWLRPSFFPPTLLAAVDGQVKAAPTLYSREPQMRLVLRGWDGRLWAYQYTGTDAEARYLGDDGVAIESQLREQTLPLVTFAQSMLGIGEIVTFQRPTDPPSQGVLAQASFEQLQKTMSPAFITADDAARYLHERPHARKSLQLGYVLQRDDDLFVSTAAIGESALSRQLGLTFDGKVVTELFLPTGYRYAGFVVLMANILETAKQGLQDRTEEEVQQGKKLSLEDEAKLYLSTPNYEFTASVMAADVNVPALYYSSPFESLVKYVRSNTQLERDFSGFLIEALRVKSFKPQLDGFDGSSVEMVRKMVRLGELHVLQTSPAWGGSLGKIPSAWAAYRSFTSAAPVPPTYSWVFEHADTAATYGQDQLAAIGGELSFILKSLKADAYVVTLPVALRPGLPVFSRQHVFNGLPTGYVPFGVCHAPRPPLGLKIEQHWLYESFISTGELAAAIAESREPINPLRVLYLSTRDGARLKYTFSGSTLESQLYGVTPTGVVTDNGHLASLIAKHSTPQQFVRQVAAAGRLAVQQVGSMGDVDGTGDSNWVPFLRYPKLTLSRPFLSADDAAAFAHEQVGRQRDAQYCGVILQTTGQRFVVTLPWLCPYGQRFNLGALFPTDHLGTMIVPQGFTLYGQYASCTAHALLDRTRMERYGWSRNEAYVDWQLFGDDDLRYLIGNRHQVSVAYLSSDEDALLGYDLSGSTAELALLKQLEPGAQGNALDRQRGEGGLRPENMVAALATLGLRIVQGSRLWGLAGAVAAHWRAYASEQAFERPEQVVFGAVFATADEAAQDAHARVRRDFGSTQTCFAFVLKHQDKEEYVVSERVPVTRATPLFSLVSLFEAADVGSYVYPSGFTLHGLFYARRWKPQGLSNGELWLAAHFIDSSNLYVAFLAAKRWQTLGSTTTLAVYVSTLDNALLRYQPAVKTTLFDAQKHASGQFEDVHTLLASGQLTAQDFVHRVIREAGLSVIATNDCWDESGVLTADWLPYADFSRRALSPAFYQQADAVRYAQALLGPGRESIYGGLVLRRTDGLFVATEPVTVPSEDFDPKFILPDEDVLPDFLAPGTTLVARYRSRRDRLPAFLLDEEELAVYRGMFSTDVLATAFTCSHLWSNEYLLGLDGSLIGFNCNGHGIDFQNARQKAQRVLDRQSLQQALAPAAQTPHDPHSNAIEQQLRDGRKTPSEVVNQVLNVAAMQVVQGSDLWGNAQQLPRGWRVAGEFVSPEKTPYATADRACGPVFSHIDDVARDIHRHAGDRSELRFGFIVKANNGHWMASRPVFGDGAQFPRSRVWPGGVLPPTCTVRGVYVLAPQQQPRELSASPVYRSFVNPSLLRSALGAVRQYTAGADTFLPLYLSCADGALLKYQAAVLDSDWDSQTRLQAYVKKLNGPFNPAEYIRKVARAGVLEVLVRGEIWASQGPVSQSWTPREAIAYVPGETERIALGPFFSHADDAARYQWRRLRHDSSNAWLGAILGNGTVPASTVLITEPELDNASPVEVGLRASTPAYQRLFGHVMNLREPKPSPKYPVGYQVIGVQQLYNIERDREALADRHEEAFARNFLPRTEIRAFIEMLRVDNVVGARYYLTPRNGALLAYLPSYLDAESKLLREDWPYYLRDKPSQAITALVNTGKLYILEPDSFWQPRGHVWTGFLMALRRQ